MDPSPTLVYASVGRRWVAVFIDGLLLGAISFVISMVTSIVLVAVSAGAGAQTNPDVANTASLVSGAVSLVVQLITWALTAAYNVYFIGKSGQTLGKKAMHIKVVKMGSTTNPTYGEAFLREVVGKFLSALVFGLGYLWAIWDKDKQTWHDKIAKTVVVKV